MVSRNSIFQKDGKTLTAYGFCCGYVQQSANKDTDLYREHAHYHVRQFRNGVRVWETYDNLTDARKFYNSIK